MPDKIEIIILDDGTIKMSTDKISAANHGGAEMLIKKMVEMAGGEVSKIRKTSHHHHHDHNHEH